MSDKDAPGSGAEQTEPSSIVPPRPPEEAERPATDSWFERLRAAVGLRGTSPRRELQEGLSGGPDGPFSTAERTLLTNILGLREVRVEDIMIPRADIEAVDIDTPVAQLMQKFESCGHSRMPVFRETLDDPVGMVHVKDLMNFVVVGARGNSGRSKGVDLSRVDLSARVGDTGLVRDVLFVPPSMPVTTLLNNMQSSRVQIALVIDEYGGTDGLVSIEDAVETIVGDIEDEHDDDEATIIAEGPGVFVADGSADLEEVAKAVGGGLADGVVGEDFDTIGGLVFSLLGRIPARGERLMTPSGHEINVLAADQRRIRRVRITAPKPAAPPAGAEPDAEPLARKAAGA